MKFNIGDRVIVVGGEYFNRLRGRIGTVVALPYGRSTGYLVDFDHPIDGGRMMEDEIEFASIQGNYSLKRNSRDAYDRFTATYGKYVDYTKMVPERLNTSRNGTLKALRSIPNVKNVIFNDPATIVFWEDGTKTIVKCTNEKYDPEKGLAMAFTKKALGNQGKYYNDIRKWLPKEASDIVEEAYNPPDELVRSLKEAFKLNE